MATAPRTAVVNLEPLPPVLLDGEERFYARYAWCLDAFPRAADVIAHLRGELARLDEASGGWQRDEVAANVFLLAAALLDAVDDHLAGQSYDFRRAANLLPFAGPVARGLEWALGLRACLRDGRQHDLRDWRSAWSGALEGFVRAALAGAAPGGVAAPPGAQLRSLLERTLPADLLARRVKVPAAFRTQDLTHHDVLRLGERCAAALADPERPRLVVGLRTAGSYFAPLVAAALRAGGCTDVETVTLRPKKRMAPHERAALGRCAARGGQVILVDEPADTGGSLARAMDLVAAAGLPVRDMVALFPVHPTRRDWRDRFEALPLSRARVITLEPEDYFKRARMEAGAAASRLSEYFRARGYLGARVEESAESERLNRGLERLSEEKFHTRLKRIYDVRLQRRDGGEERRYVIAKSVGWGWLGYHAVLAGQALAGLVPPVIGLRDGILYSEWLPGDDRPVTSRDRERLIEDAGAYVAARVRSLRLPQGLSGELDPANQKGPELLACVLAGAHGPKAVSILRRGRIRQELARRPCPVPTLVDGKMRRVEWVRGRESFLKTDFEHHGLGKTELNVTDPAYDLADAMLHLRLTPAEERALLRRYRRDSGDHGVEDRLFLHAILAGSASIAAALADLRDPRVGQRHGEADEAYVTAREFLTLRAARTCGRWTTPPEHPRWTSPVVVMDIDGVLDKEVFGFPSTTAAGVQALAHLHRHGVALAFNTARTLEEVEEYAQAYGGVGGVAEYGAVAWDRVSGRTRALVSPESRDQLMALGAALRRVPGVFLNDRYRHSLRAYTYLSDRTAPLPAGLIHGLLARVGADRLVIHQTYRDTAVLARETDKGRGLLALMDLAGLEAGDAVAIGDSEPDLPMFRAAGRSFAPRHISGREVARQLGCRIAPAPYQRGLLAAVEEIVHADGRRCARCAPPPRPRDGGLFWELLVAADRKASASLLRALADPRSLQAFVR
jgi:hydroxymethylpyrimidine pyrophosphatase-like HAD family hydrolase/orotate phosphoribosyltransferase